MMLDILSLKADTPGAGGHIHLDNAGSSLFAGPVFQALQEYQALELKVGGYEAAEIYAGTLSSTYDNLCRLINAEAGSIAITPSATTAFDLALYSMPFQAGDVILTAFNDYCANYVAYLHLKKTRGIEIRTVPPAENGDVDLAAFTSMLDKNVKLISLNHVPSTTGQVVDAIKIGKMARQANVPFLLDACQSVGQLPVDVQAIGCDMMSATSRKFLRGPRGMGFLYVSPEMISKLSPVFVTNQGGAWTKPDDYTLLKDARLFETWERNAALQVMLKAALDYFFDKGEGKLLELTQDRAGYLRQGLQSIPHVKIEDRGHKQSAIITINVNGMQPDTALQLLKKHKITANIARSRHALLDMRARGLDNVVRLSPHYYLSNADLDHALNVIEGLAKGMK